MKLRIQNNARGERGVYVDGALVFIAPGNTATYEKASAGERDVVVASGEFRVWTDTGNGWEEVTRPEDAPVQHAFLAIAKGARGEDMRSVDLAEGEWFLGTAISADKPEGPQGYAWAKVGGADEVGEAPAPDANYRAPTETLNVGPAKFDAAAYVSDKMPDVVAGIADMSAERLQSVKEAELATEKPRKGVLTAIEEREEELMA